MKIDGLDWMEWLHKMREEEYLKRKGLTPLERLRLIGDEAEESIKRLGLKKSPPRKRHE